MPFRLMQVPYVHTFMGNMMKVGISSQPATVDAFRYDVERDSSVIHRPEG
jgi:hypothetical protein